MASQWSGERPTPEDFLAVLRSPLQVKIAEAHTTVNRSSYPVAEDTLVLSQEYLRTNTTDESFAAAAGGDPRRVKRTIEGFDGNPSGENRLREAERQEAGPPLAGDEKKE